MTGRRPIHSRPSAALGPALFRPTFGVALRVTERLALVVRKLTVADRLAIYVCPKKRLVSESVVCNDPHGSAAISQRGSNSHG